MGGCRPDAAPEQFHDRDRQLLGIAGEHFQVLRPTAVHGLRLFRQGEVELRELAFQLGE